MSDIDYMLNEINAYCQSQANCKECKINHLKDFEGSCACDITTEQGLQVIEERYKVIVNLRGERGKYMSNIEMMRNKLTDYCASVGECEECVLDVCVSTAKGTLEQDVLRQFVKMNELEHDDVSFDDMRNKILDYCAGAVTCEACVLEPLKQGYRCMNDTADGKEERMRERYDVIRAIEKFKQNKEDYQATKEKLHEATNEKLLTQEESNKVKYNIELTESQLISLSEFIELDFIGSIKSDDGVGDMNYLCDICGIYEQLRGFIERD